MALLGTAALAMLVWTSLVLGTSLGVSAGWKAIEGPISRWHPADRARICAVLATAPFSLPTLVLALCLAPGLLGFAGLPVDHCDHHPGHLHLCLAHPRILLSLPLAVGLAALATAGVVLVGHAAVRLARVQRGAALLRLAASTRVAPDVVEVDTPHPFSLTTGLVRPGIWISTGLSAALSEAQLAVVIAHERAHVGRRDPLLRWLCGLLAAPLWPGVRRSILERLHVASEQVCDEAAARDVGDPVLVAETLLTVARLDHDPRGRASLEVAPAFGEGSVRERILRLLDGREQDPAAHSRRWIAIPAGVSLLAALPLHHMVEHVLETFARIH